MPETRLRAWERQTELPLMVLALAFLAAYAAPILFVDLSSATVRLASMTQTVVWGMFALDYVIRLTSAANRLHFVRRNLLDLAAVLLPMLRPLRLLRVISTALLMTQRAQASTRYTVTTYVSGTALLVVFLSALAVLDAERGQPDATIQTPADALWWAFATVTTVGYGDTYPVTATGRVVAILLMITGIALLGVITANVASWFVERFNESGEDAQQERDQLAQILAEVKALRREQQEADRTTATDGTPDHAQLPLTTARRLREP